MTVFLLVSTVGAPVGDGQPDWQWWWVLIPAGLYLLHLAMWPMRKCWACGGKGKQQAPIGKAWRDCSMCDGKGNRPRWAAFRRY